MAKPIMASKLRIPPLRPKVLQRPHLSQLVNEGLENNRQVTLISAPAGFGKTTCVSDWVTSQVLDGWKVAWLSLDSLDDDPVRFFTYFIAALQKMQSNLGEEIEGVIGSGQLPGSEIISTTLINDLLASESRFLLILDDFHVIQDGLILQVLKNLIENSSDRMHLILITREDPPLPLARLRANNQLTEIRARDLRFTHNEIDRFLHEVTGLSLSKADIKTLEEKTEGWIAGLQLAAMAMNEPVVQESQRSLESMRDRVDHSRFIASLSGSHRYIWSYLTEQVLNQQSEEIRLFLLETSILEKFNVDLCNAISGRFDSDSLIEQLFNANLFLIPLDYEQEWYRYHHLFSDLLRDLFQRYQKEKTSDLHRRAARWFAQAGMVSDAIHHALAGEDYVTAVELLEGHAIELIMQGFAKTVDGWIQTLPEKYRSQSPKTNLAFAWALLLRGNYAEAIVYLERLQTILSDLSLYEKDAAILAEWLVMQSLVLFMQGRLMECKQMVAEALDRIQEQDRRVRSLAHYVQASISRLEEDYQQAVEGYQKSIREGQLAASPVPEILSTASLAGMAIEQGQLHLAFEVTSQAVRRIEHSGELYPISAMIYASLGEVCYQWYQLEAARQYFQEALHLSILGGANTITILCRVLLSRLSLSKGDLETANWEIQQAEEQLPSETPAYVKQEVVSQRVRVSLARSRPSAAAVALQGFGIPFHDLKASFDLLIRPNDSDLKFQQSSSSAGLFNSILRIHLYQARAANDPARILPAVKYADQVVAWAFKSQQLMVVLETLLLRAQLHALLRDQTASTADYAQALDLAQSEGFISVFIEGGWPVTEALTDFAMQNQVGMVQSGYLDRLLDVLANLHAEQSEPDARDAAIEPYGRKIVEALTDRELEVLRFMGEGLKYKEIGAKLYISQNTVRYHVKAIYGKFQVNNRMQAVAKARKLHLL